MTSVSAITPIVPTPSNADRALQSSGISPKTFDAIAGFLKRASGFCLTPEKSYLINTRLARVAGEFKLDSVDALAAKLADKQEQALHVAVVEAMTTNETLFFRDGRPFETLIKTVLPALCAAAASSPVRILSAAASTGQEPYSIAITIRENAPQLVKQRLEIVATDIDSKVLETAAKAVYTKFDVQRGVPTPLLIKYFREHDNGKWILTDDIRSMVGFRKMNLLEDLSALGTFDILFCRNVLIYFDVPTKARALGGLAKIARPGACLFLGASETAAGISDKWVALGDARAVYKRAAG